MAYMCTKRQTAYLDHYGVLDPSGNCWLFAKFLRSQFLKLIGIPPEVYKEFTPEEKELAQEMLDVMHPMSLRGKGSIHEFEIMPLDSVAMSEISAPTLILHSQDDKLVNYKHAEFAHKNIKQLKLISFETDGHGLLPKPFVILTTLVARYKRL